MKLVVLAAALLAATALAAPPKFQLRGDAARGKPVFDMFCVPCHGETGNGAGPAGAALEPKPADFTDAARAALSTDEQIYGLIKEGGIPVNKSPLMVSWKGTLNDQQMRDVAVYIRNFSRPAGAKDAGAKDAGVKDAGAKDAGVKDAGVKDAGVKDAGVKGASAKDAGVKAPKPTGPATKK